MDIPAFNDLTREEWREKVNCPDCDGIGYTSLDEWNHGSIETRCKTCNAMGQITRQQKTMLDLYAENARLRELLVRIHNGLYSAIGDDELILMRVPSLVDEVYSVVNDHNAIMKHTQALGGDDDE